MLCYPLNITLSPPPVFTSHPVLLTWRRCSWVEGVDVAQVGAGTELVGAGTELVGAGKELVGAGTELVGAWAELEFHLLIRFC